MTLHGFEVPDARLPTVALTARDRTPAQLADRLARRGVIASAGLQCAPLAHETLGTAPAGVLRLSVGPWNDDDDDVARALDALGAALTSASE